MWTELSRKRGVDTENLGPRCVEWYQILNKYINKYCNNTPTQYELSTNCLLLVGPTSVCHPNICWYKFHQCSTKYSSVDHISLNKRFINLKFVSSIMYICSLWVKYSQGLQLVSMPAYFIHKSLLAETHQTRERRSVTCSRFQNEGTYAYYVSSIHV